MSVARGELLRDRIRLRADRLSPAQRRLAEYILQNAHRVAFMTAAELGEAVGVSESTVVRFATALGYSGYPEMQRELQEAIWSQLTARDRMELARTSPSSSVVEQVLREDIENLRATLREVSREAFAQAVEALHTARHVYLAGFRGAATIAHYLAFYLSFIRKDVYRLQEAGAVFEQLVTLNSEDLVVLISFPRYSRLTVDIAEFARERGARTLALTDSVLSPIARLADITLVARTQLTSYVDSLAAPLSLASALLTALALKDRERTQQVLAELERIWAKYHIYTVES